MIEFEVDMDTVLDDADLVWLHDERGELPPMRFVPERTLRDSDERECRLEIDRKSEDELFPAYDISCSACGESYFGGDVYNYCPNCGAKAVE